MVIEDQSAQIGANGALRMSTYDSPSLGTGQKQCIGSGPLFVYPDLDFLIVFGRYPFDRDDVKVSLVDIIVRDSLPCSFARWVDSEVFASSCPDRVAEAAMLAKPDHLGISEREVFDGFEMEPSDSFLRSIYLQSLSSRSTIVRSKMRFWIGRPGVGQHLYSDIVERDIGQCGAVLGGDVDSAFGPTEYVGEPSVPDFANRFAKARPHGYVDGLSTTPPYFHRRQRRLSGRSTSNRDHRESRLHL